MLDLRRTSIMTCNKVVSQLLSRITLALSAAEPRNVQAKAKVGYLNLICIYMALELVTVLVFVGVLTKLHWELGCLFFIINIVVFTIILVKDYLLNIMNIFKYQRFTEIGFPVIHYCNPL